MGNSKHIEIASKGAKAIEEWKKNNPNIRLDLEGGKFRRGDFVKANLCNAILRNADLELADFRWADLVDTDFTGAKLIRADFHKADLTQASLCNADLSLTNFEDAILNKVDLTNSTFSKTILYDAEMTDAVGLETINHKTDSIYNNNMFVKSNNLSETFLKGIGLRNPYQALVYRVFIGSPSDVTKERKAVRDAIYKWNDFESKRVGRILLPVLRETHATPEYGNRAQEIINHQLIKNCHILICIFWTNLGTPTEGFESGTVEEIIKFHEAGNPVAIYFSNKLIPLDHDPKQLKKLKEFEKRLQKNALIGYFKSTNELKTLLNQHLSNIVEKLDAGKK